VARPIPAALAFNGLALLSHWQVIVNGASSNGLFHYGMHTALVTTAVLFWIPVCGPFPELRISPPAQMVYLFVASIVPTVPGAWLTFANGAVYSVYDIPDRLWGLTVTSDQQIAGLLMKLGAGSYLWVIITVIFFRWAGTLMSARDRSVDPAPTTLTYEQVEREFESHPPPRAEV
jgi:putative membrane protein